ncbi:TetR/AcrR family transcriptional regulator [Pigmentiphaga soli]|uniref:TetR/AcrR family transcriptional regulator n=1 Tax=Pigmentiphaga soli TaxID=1007095 RepID=A0ABP8HC85_9BURK
MPASAPSQDPPPAPRTRNAAATRERILRAAIAEFAAHGFGGARIERICEEAGIAGRMIYYYFQSKESLFIAALDAVYAQLAEAEAALDLESLDPRDAMRRLVAFVWHHFRAHPELLGLLATENQLGGQHVRGRPTGARHASRQLAILAGILERGAAAGQFRRDATVLDVFMTISALCYHPLANRHTLADYLGRDMEDDAVAGAWLAHIGNVVLDYLTRR